MAIPATAYREDDQQQRSRLQHCLPDNGWSDTVDVSVGEARVGVRCASRDHLPMVGSMPDYTTTLTHYADLPAQQAADHPAPLRGELTNLDKQVVPHTDH